MPLSGDEMMKYTFANILPYRIVMLNTNLEIFNRNRIIGIYQILDGIKEYRSLFKYESYAHLSNDSYLYPMENNQIKKCIFCHKTSDNVTFKKKPHVIPYLLGNHFLLHHEECDTCNEFFGETLECELDKYLKPYRTLNRQKNRKGKLIRTEFSPKRSFRFDENQNEYVFDLLEDEYVFNFKSNSLAVKLKQEVYRPILVYKALIKIILGLLPREHLPNFEHLRNWIIDRDYNSLILSHLNVIKTRLSGFPHTPLDVLILHKNISTLDEFKTKLPLKENFEYLACIRFGNIIFEIPLFSDLTFEKLWVMKDSGMKLEFSFPTIPKPGFPTNRELLDFAKTQKVKSEETIFFSYDSVIEKNLVSDLDI